MYNGVGLSTPRGSGTNGFIQRNVSSLNNFRERRRSERRTNLEQSSRSELADPSMLLHQRKRQVEVKCFKLRKELESRGREQGVIDAMVEELRRELLVQTCEKATPEGGVDTEVLDEDVLRDQRNERLRKAFRLSDKFAAKSATLRPVGRQLAEMPLGQPWQKLKDGSGSEYLQQPLYESEYTDRQGVDPRRPGQVSLQNLTSYRRSSAYKDYSVPASRHSRQTASPQRQRRTSPLVHSSPRSNSEGSSSPTRLSQSNADELRRDFKIAHTHVKDGANTRSTHQRTVETPDSLSEGEVCVRSRVGAISERSPTPPRRRGREAVRERSSRQFGRRSASESSSLSPSRSPRRRGREAVRERSSRQLGRRSASESSSLSPSRSPRRRGRETVRERSSRQLGRRNASESSSLSPSRSPRRRGREAVRERSSRQLGRRSASESSSLSPSRSTSLRMQRKIPSISPVPQRFESRNISRRSKSPRQDSIANEFDNFKSSHVSVSQGPIRRRSRASSRSISASSYRRERETSLCESDGQHVEQPRRRKRCSSRSSSLSSTTSAKYDCRRARSPPRDTPSLPKRSTLGASDVIEKSKFSSAPQRVESSESDFGRFHHREGRYGDDFWCSAKFRSS